METTAANRRVAETEEKLANVHRRLVGIHAALAERPTIDADVRRWTIHELMDVLRVLERANR
jgi:hypothetical protein